MAQAGRPGRRRGHRRVSQVGFALQPRLSFLGTSHLLCEAPLPIDLAWQRRLWGLAARARLWASVTEAVLGMNNLLLVFDPLALDGDALSARVLDAWPDCESDIPRGKSVEVPVRYGGEAGPDLCELARNAGITVQKFVKLHTGPEYTVFFVGGYPGQPHLGRLHPLLVSPRRHEPRMRVPVGSVAIGGEQASVYPSTQPGGMQLIGHTDVVFFDVARSPPSLLAPGDRVRFRSLGIEK